MKTVTVKTAELEGMALDWAVAKAAGEDVYISPCGDIVRRPYFGDYSPSRDWQCGGAFIEKYRVEMGFCGDDNLYFPNEWYAQLDDDGRCHQHHALPLVAAMRAIIQAVLGDTVEIPEELVK